MAQQGNGQLPAVNWVLWLLMLPAISVAVFTRRGFGFRAVQPLRLFAAVVFMAFFHDIGRSPDQPNFFDGSLSWRFCELMVIVGLYHYFVGLRRYRSGVGHTHFFGEPWLTRLGLPFQTATFADAAVITIFGYLLHSFDRTLGAWFMYAGIGVGVLMAFSWRQQALDAEDMHNARIYAEHVQGRARGTGSTASATSSMSDTGEDLSTGPSNSP